MRIVCPACSARYEVKETLLIQGRKTRCARCGAEWVPPRPAAESATPITAAAPAPAPAPVPPSTPAPDLGKAPDQTPEKPGDTTEPPLGMTSLAGLTAMDRLYYPPPPPPMPLALRLAWAATAIIIPCMIGSGLYWRNTVMESWPPSARIYSALGLTGTADHQ